VRFYWLLLGILAVWRVTHALNAEDGPGDLFVKVRRLAGGGFFGKLLDCFYCLSLWVAAPFAWWLGEGWKEQLLLWPALSAGAIILERVTAEKPAPADQRAEYVELTEEEADELLRRQETIIPTTRRDRP